MAKYKMCTVLDMVAQQFGRPFFTVSEGAAIRGFSDEVNRPNEQSMLYQHPNDFQLFLMGEFDDETGLIELADQPSLLVSGSAVRAAQPAG